MSSSNPFDDDDSNPFFETTKIKSPINEEDVFGGRGVDDSTETLNNGQAPMPEMATPSGGPTSNSALLFAINEEDNAENEAKPINFDDEQAASGSATLTTTTSDGNEGENKRMSFTDKAVGAAANLLFGGNDDDDNGGGEDNGGETENDPNAPQRPRRKWYHFWKPSFYQPYFDVDTKDVLRRCVAGLVPVGKPFFERVEGNPDFYGPFWVTTTVLFLLAIASNFAEYIAYWSNGVESHWTYDFYKISIGAGVFYGFLILVPLVLWLLVRFLVKVKLTPIQVYCVYGYSLSSFLVATPFCIAPFEWVRYLVIAVACVLSCICVVVAFFKALKQNRGMGLIVIIFALVCQVALSFVYKFYFFAKIEVPESFSSSA